MAVVLMRREPRLSVPSRLVELPSNCWFTTSLFLPPRPVFTCSFMFIEICQIVHRFRSASLESARWVFISAHTHTHRSRVSFVLKRRRRKKCSCQTNTGLSAQGQRRSGGGTKEQESVGEGDGRDGTSDRKRELGGGRERERCEKRLSL